MGLDIRWPIGFMFTFIGVLLTLNGLLTASNTEMYKKSLDININLWWGLVLLVFGGFMLILAWKDRNKDAKSAAASSEPKEMAGKK